MPRDFSILLILETGSRELIGGVMGWGGGGQRLSGENRVGGGIEWGGKRTSRRIIPSIVKGGKKENYRERFDLAFDSLVESCRGSR